jgi:phosphohistidine phosphatase
VALAAPGSPELSQLKEKLPTAAAVSFEFDEELWKKLRPESGRVVLFLSPKTLPASGQG